MKYFLIPLLIGFSIGLCSFSAQAMEDKDSGITVGMVRQAWKGSKILDTPHGRYKILSLDDDPSTLNFETISLRRSLFSLDYYPISHWRGVFFSLFCVKLDKVSNLDDCLATSDISDIRKIHEKLSLELLSMGIDFNK